MAPNTGLAKVSGNGPDASMLHTGEQGDLECVMDVVSNLHPLPQANGGNTATLSSSTSC